MNPLYKLFRLSGKLDRLKNHILPSRGMFLIIKKSTINIKKEVDRWILSKLENTLQVRESHWR